MPTIKTSSIALVSLPIMVLLATIGWVYPHLPSHWWHPVSIFWFTLITAQILFMNSIVLLVAFGLLVAFSALLQRKVKPFKRRCYLALMPMISGSLMAPWAAYCSQQKVSGAYALANKTHYWYFSVIADLFFVSIAIAVPLFFYFLFSDKWEEDRDNALALLGGVLASLCTLGFMSCAYAGRLPF